MSRLIPLFILSCVCLLQAQVGVNTTDVHPSALMEMQNNSSGAKRGLLIPRMTTEERDNINIGNQNAADAPHGLLIYNTTERAFQYWDGGSWFTLNRFRDCGFSLSVTTVSTTIDNLGSSRDINFTISNQSGNPGAYEISLLSASPLNSEVNFNISYTNNNNNNASKGVTLSLNASGQSSYSPGDVVSLVFQVKADCDEVREFTVNITISGCDFNLAQSGTTEYIQQPSSGNNTRSFLFTVTQNGTNAGTISIDPADIIGTDPDVTISISGNNCSYSAGTCNITITFTVSPSTPASSYLFSIPFESSCDPGNPRFADVTIVVEDYARDCLSIKTDNPSLSGLSQQTIDPDGTSVGSIDPFECTCDFSTDGGGWTLVMNYEHMGRTTYQALNGGLIDELVHNPQLDARTLNLPQLDGGSSPIERTIANINAGYYGNDASVRSLVWGHAAPALLGEFEFSEVRFYGQTSSHARTVHFKTTHDRLISYFKTGRGRIDPSEFRSSGVSTALTGHGGIIFSNVNNRSGNRRDFAMTNQPFTVRTAGVTTADWRLKQNDEWDMDDNVNNDLNNTIHRVWVR